MVIASVRIRGSIEQIRGVLLDAEKLPSWNPAFLSIGPAGPDGAYPIRVRPGLRGVFRYLRTDRLRLESSWRVRGLSETNYWSVQPDGDQTLVEHGFAQHGPIATILRGAFATAAQLRVDRLKARIESDGGR
jgi:hypothetical protein